MVYCHYIDNPVVVGDFEWEILLAKLTVQLLELYHDLLPVRPLRALRLKPAPQTLQVDRANRACAVAR